LDRTRAILRNGDWITRERVWLVAFTLLAASLAGLLYLVVTAHGLVDRQGRPLGTDFSSFYAAGSYVLDGRPEAPFNLAQQHAREQQIFGAGTPFYSWFYPPFFLFIAGVLALMPYGVALAVWQLVTLGFYLLTIKAILRPISDKDRESNVFSGPLWLLLALAFPAVLVNVGHGQNGFLTAALLGAGLVQLDRRPFIAGVLFGCLAYKPQFGLMIPLVLAASGRWRTFGGAVATVALLAAATLVIFGVRVWPAFLDSTRFARLVALEQGDVGWYKIQSVFAWARMWGAPVPLAYVLQGALDLAVAASLVRFWRITVAPHALKAAGLCVGAILATPFALDYDMIVLGPAIAFFAVDGLTRGFGPWEKTTLAMVWLAPLAARSVAQLTLIPLGVLAMLAMFVVVLRRAELDRASPMAFAGTASTVVDGGTARGHDIAAFE
jgi:alpha-1,2-mannosyltransferase